MAEIKTFILFSTVLCAFQCLKVIPERSTLTYLNYDYFYNASTFVRRTCRGCDYILNIEFFSKIEYGNNVTIDFIFYEYLHNEYKPSFIEMHFKLCDLVYKDPYIGAAFRKAGVTKCPIPPGKCTLKGISFSIDFPYVFPFEKGKVVLIATIVPSNIQLARGELVLTIKQALPKLKN